MKITVVQPAYFAGEHPDESIRAFLKERLSALAPGELMVLPEYANAGGHSEEKPIRAALSEAADMLSAASNAAKTAGGYVAVNVLEEQDGVLLNSTHLFAKDGKTAFVYHKQHLPPAEIRLGVRPGEPDGKCRCVCDLDGIRFAFLTCYDVYFNEQIEFIARAKPDILVVCGYQRAERTDIIEAQIKLLAFRCNAFVARASYSMNDREHGGNSMIVAPDGKILQNIGAGVGAVSAEVDSKEKYLRSAGFGGGMVRNDDFIGNGTCPDAF